MANITVSSGPNIMADMHIIATAIIERDYSPTLKAELERIAKEYKQYYDRLEEQREYQRRRANLHIPCPKCGKQCKVEKYRPMVHHEEEYDYARCDDCGLTSCYYDYLYCTGNQHGIIDYMVEKMADEWFSIETNEPYKQQQSPYKRVDGRTTLTPFKDGEAPTGAKE